MRPGDVVHDPPPEPDEQAADDQGPGDVGRAYAPNSPRVGSKYGPTKRMTRKAAIGSQSHQPSPAARRGGLQPVARRGRERRVNRRRVGRHAARYPPPTPRRQAGRGAWPPGTGLTARTDGERSRRCSRRLVTGLPRPHGSIRRNIRGSGSTFRASPVERHPPPHADADRRHLRRRAVAAVEPDARRAGIEPADDAERQQRVDDRLLQQPHVRPDAQPPVGQADDRVGDELPRPVVGDVAAAVALDDLDVHPPQLGVARQDVPPRRLGAASEGQDVAVLDEEERLPPAGQDVGVGLLLPPPGVAVGEDAEVDGPHGPAPYHAGGPTGVTGVILPPSTSAATRPVPSPRPRPEPSRRGRRRTGRPARPPWRSPGRAQGTSTSGGPSASVTSPPTGPAVGAQ